MSQWCPGEQVEPGFRARSSSIQCCDPHRFARASSDLANALARPQDRQWMWSSGHDGDIRRAAHGYEATREAAMAAFAKSWQNE